MTTDLLAVEVDNITPIKAYIVTLFATGDLRSITILNRVPSQHWGYYSLTCAKGSPLEVAHGQDEDGYKLAGHSVRSRA